jgi:hypothetical protein
MHAMLIFWMAFAVAVIVVEPYVVLKIIGLWLAIVVLRLVW